MNKFSKLKNKENLTNYEESQNKKFFTNLLLFILQVSIQLDTWLQWDFMLLQSILNAMKKLLNKLKELFQKSNNWLTKNFK